MYDKSLMIKILPSELVIKNIVHGDNKCNYELYLLELVNKSSYFLNLSHGCNYNLPKNESNGECDCISEAYQLDFKLLCSKTYLQAKSVLFNQKSVLAKGVMSLNPPKLSKGNIKATNIHVILRKYSYSQLCELRRLNPKGNGLENDICHLLKTLEKKKNLLLFFHIFLVLIPIIVLKKLVYKLLLL